MNARPHIDPMDGWRAMAAALAIAHHIPGRIRLKLAGTAAVPAGVVARVRQFCRVAPEVPGIRSAKLNPLAGSCVVEYDPAAIPPAAWEELSRGQPTEAAERLLRRLVEAAGA